MLIPKQKSYRSKKLRNSARGQMCLLKSTDCNFNPETTVLCHDDSITSGKGTGYKAHDFFALFGCSCCHANIGKHKSRIPYAIKSTWRWWANNGFLEINDKCAFDELINIDDWVECKRKFLELWEEGVINVT